MSKLKTQQNADLAILVLKEVLRFLVERLTWIAHRMLQARAQLTYICILKPNSIRFTIQHLHKS